MNNSNFISFRKIALSIILVPVLGLLTTSINSFEPTPTVAVAQSSNPETPDASASTVPTNTLIIPYGIEVIAPYLNLREGPGLDSLVVDVLQAGEVLTITNLSPDLHWVEILTAENRAGWVSSAPEYVSLNTIVDEPITPDFSVESVPVLLASATTGGPDQFGRTNFAWEYDGQLPEGVGFEIRVWREGEQPLGIHNAVIDNTEGKIKYLGNNTYSYAADISKAPGVKGAGDYLWTVELGDISRGEAGYETIGVGAEPAPLGIEVPNSDPPSAVPSSVAAPAYPCGPAGTVETNGQYVVVKVFYGTDRKATGDSDVHQYFGGERSNDSISYGTAEVTIPKNHKRGAVESPDFWVAEWRKQPTKFVTLHSLTAHTDQNRFFAELRARIEASSKKNAFVFVHGFNVNFEDAARRTGQMACDLEFEGAPIFYSWPSDGSIPGYFTDEADVEWSTPHLMKFLQSISQDTGAEAVYVIGHSMGNRTVTGALKGMIETGNADALPIFREVIMAAADIDRSVFIKQLAPPLTFNYPRLTLYASSKDKALRLSKWIHGYTRVGDFADGPFIFDGLDSIDATSVETDWWGHGYYAAPSVIDDLGFLLNNGSSPVERSRLSRVEFPPGFYWIILP